ncbi:MAG: hypothetical protein J5I47_00340 [Vicingus serpentipes]|nr:hypothetical protein [Vicingus serpentipes]
MKTTFLTLTTLFISTTLFCQSFNSPVEYMNYMSDKYKIINKDTWDYTSAVAHGKSARKVEKRRNELLKTIDQSKKSIQKIKGYNGENELRDSVVSFLEINYNVINYDYEKIVDMEAIAEQSYDAMEAYIMAQDKAGEKLRMANDMLQLQQNQYATSHNILIDGELDKISKNLKAANEVFDYYHEVYLIFFKSYKQEAYLLDAIQRADVNSMEQNSNALLSASEEGIEKLKEIKSFRGDASIKTSALDMLNFYKKESEEDMNTITDFYLKTENFNKVKAAFEAKKESNRTQQDVDEFNKAVNDINSASESYNKKNNTLFQKRSELLNKWNNSVSSFLDRHVAKK